KAERDVSEAAPGAADDLYAAGERPRLPAQLPARELARLSLLGYRTRPGVITRSTVMAIAHAGLRSTSRGSSISISIFSPGKGVAAICVAPSVTFRVGLNVGSPPSFWRLVAA